jgi:hypothetical protein
VALGGETDEEAGLAEVKVEALGAVVPEKTRTGICSAAGSLKKARQKL